MSVGSWVGRAEGMESACDCGVLSWMAETFASGELTGAGRRSEALFWFIEVGIWSLGLVAEDINAELEESLFSLSK